MANYDFTYTGAEIQAILDTAKKLKDSGYIFLGVATPSTNPGTPTQKVYYEAKQAGTYTNFGGVVLPDGMSLLIWNGSWTSETVMSGDGGVFDISVYKSTGGTLATFADLSAALDGGNNIPVGARKGGMSVKYVQSSDNKYVYSKLRTTSFSTDENDWESVSGLDVKAGNDYDLIIGDANDYAIIVFKDGYFKTKNFDAAKIQRDVNIHNRISSTTEDPTILKLSDNNGNIVARFSDGHIKTRYFDSEVSNRIRTTTDNPNNLYLVDKTGNIIASFENGSLRTKFFSSAKLRNELTALKNMVEGLSKTGVHGSTFCFYGDSITAQCNGDIESFTNEIWASQVAEKLGLIKYYGRGVGGQTYRWNTKGWYCASGGTGNYAGRYTAVGGVISSANPEIDAVSYTEQEKSDIESVLGYSIDIHKGCLCSWDRITAMFPESIKDNIAVVFIMAGTNDFWDIEDVYENEPQWSASNTIDTDWVNSAQYLGGDYDVTNTFGALASTIMKFRVWMPNAKIIVATPIARKGTNYNAFKNPHNISYQDLADCIIKVSQYANTRCIDMYGGCGINQFNIDTTCPDGIHPVLAGWNLMADYIIDCLISFQL